MVLGLLLTSACLLTGCSNSADADPAPSVASVATAAPGKSAPAAEASATADLDRPYFRPDMTDDEVIRLSNLYESCLINHGVPAAVKGKQVKSWDDGRAQYADARKACQDKKAEQYEERLARVDPTAHKDYLRISLACLKAGGIKAELNAAGTDVEINPNTPVAKALDVQVECGMKAYQQTK